ncbi:MAG: deoxyribose-phosphate aldolase [Ignavibacteria bacterium]|nr:deoxyribose-phosphate aldolase [Ignavibacteria bacterium]
MSSIVPVQETTADFDASLAAMIDHTLLKPEATIDQIEQLCDEARQYRFASVCVNPCYVRTCVEHLRGTTSKVCTVVGFPLGASSSAAKAFEAEQAIQEGAREIDMVINVGMLKSGNHSFVEDEIRAVVTVAKRSAALTKVILETSLLTEDEKAKACQLAKQAGADFVKTSTGFGGGGATIEDVALMRRIVGPSMGVKASGGIRTYEEARAMIASGANRLGTSASVKIVAGQKGPAPSSP